MEEQICHPKAVGAAGDPYLLFLLEPLLCLPVRILVPDALTGFALAWRAAGLGPLSFTRQLDDDSRRGAFIAQRCVRMTTCSLL